MTDIGNAVSELSSPENWKNGGLVLVGFFLSDAIMPNITRQVPVGETNLHEKFPEVNGLLTAVGSYAVSSMGYVGEEKAEFVAYGGIASTTDQALDRTGLKTQLSSEIGDALTPEQD